ncbi:MAG: NAD(P)H-binding protein [Proteobacteria bacterium]|nr:NAD(P)H-binding protein [Pseudomonadota bacterium]HQR05122.1 NAD(P)H-binding protein [Rhodocyclaceae bacterium]
MKITIFGATGNLGSECLHQALAAGHEVSVLVRTPQKLRATPDARLSILQGDALNPDDVRLALPEGTAAILFAIGVDERTSPRDLCTDTTRHILQAMRERRIQRLVWCGGGSNFLPQDRIGAGARFVRWYSETFLEHRHSDKEHQLELLLAARDIEWAGIRPLRMVPGPRTEKYRLGYEKFSGLSRISFADCAHAMVGMLQDRRWTHQAPIIQY